MADFTNYSVWKRGSILNSKMDNKPNSEEKSGGIQDNSSQSFFLNSSVRRCKNRALKIRLQTLIKAKGLSEADFYKELGYSRQVWYAMSWGIWETSIEHKVRIAKALSVDSSVIFDFSGVDLHDPPQRENNGAKNERV